MGQLTQFFQPPLYWQQFEELTKTLVERIYGTTADLVGRPGQAQDGVDVICRTKTQGWLGVQCKRLSDMDENNMPLPGGAITKKLLWDEAKKSLGHKSKLNTWVLATTAKRDAVTQKHAIDLNEERRASNVTGTVIVWSWDDYISWLNLFPDIQAWYYDTVIQVRDASDLDRIILELFAVAFHRPAFEDALMVENADDFTQALSDTQRAMRTGELVDRESRHVIRKAIGGWRELSNPDTKEQMRQLDAHLRAFRALLFHGQKNGTISQRHRFMEIKDHRLVATLEGHRELCVQMLNDVLLKVGVAPIR